MNHEGQRLSHAKSILIRMSEHSRDESGQFSPKVTAQDVLKAFDRTDDPFLTAPELADTLGVTRHTITRRLREMQETGLVDRKEAGSHAVVWWAERAPRLSAEARAGVEASREQIERGETVSQDEMKQRLGIDQ